MFTISPYFNLECKKMDSSSYYIYNQILLFSYRSLFVFLFVNVLSCKNRNVVKSMLFPININY